MPYKDIDKKRKASRDYYQRNKEKIIARTSLYIKNNRKKYNEYSKLFYKKNKEYYKKYNQINSYKLYKKQYRINNLKKLTIYEKEYYNLNKLYIKKRHHHYYILNKKKINSYIMNLYNNDSNFKLCKNLRTRLFIALKGRNKSQSTLQLLGCSIEELKLHLQQTAIKNGYNDFNINNYSGKKYHIDHIKPCASFDLSDPEQQKECFNWKNLQILTVEENLSKGCIFNV